MRVRRTRLPRTRKQLESTEKAGERSPENAVRDQANDATGSSVTARALQILMGDRKAVLRSVCVFGFFIGAIWVSGVEVKLGWFEIGHRTADTCRAPEVVHVPIPMPASPQLPAEPAVSDPVA